MHFLAHEHTSHLPLRLPPQPSVRKMKDKFAFPVQDYSVRFKHSKHPHFHKDLYLDGPSMTRDMVEEVKRVNGPGEGFDKFMTELKDLKPVLHNHRFEFGVLYDGKVSENGEIVTKCKMWKPSTAPETEDVKIKIIDGLAQNMRNYDFSVGLDVDKDAQGNIICYHPGEMSITEQRYFDDQPTFIDRTSEVKLSASAMATTTPTAPATKETPPTPTPTNATTPVVVPPTTTPVTGAPAGAAPTTTTTTSAVPTTTTTTPEGIEYAIEEGDEMDYTVTKAADGTLVWKEVKDVPNYDKLKVSWTDQETYKRLPPGGKAAVDAKINEMREEIVKKRKADFEEFKSILPLIKEAKYEDEAHASDVASAVANPALRRLFTPLWSLAEQNAAKDKEIATLKQTIADQDKVSALTSKRVAVNNLASPNQPLPSTSRTQAQQVALDLLAKRGKSSAPAIMTTGGVTPTSTAPTTTPTGQVTASKDANEPQHTSVFDGLYNTVLSGQRFKTIGNNANRAIMH